MRVVQVAHKIARKYIPEGYGNKSYGELVAEIARELGQAQIDGYNRGLSDVSLDLLDIQEKTEFGNPKSADRILEEVQEKISELRYELTPHLEE